MNINQIEKTLEYKQANMHHVNALIRALGNPSEWTYTGEMIDTGALKSYCACGHPIRYEFVIEHPESKKRAVLGSTCIEHYAHFSPESAKRMMKDFEDFKERLKEEKKRIKEMNQQKEIVELEKQLDPIIKDFKEIVVCNYKNGWLPYEIYTIRNDINKRVKKLDNYKRLTSKIKAYKNLIDAVPKNIEYIKNNKFN